MTTRPASLLVLVFAASLAGAFACGPTLAPPASPPAGTAGPENTSAPSATQPPEGPVDVSVPRAGPSAAPTASVSVATQGTSSPPPLDPPCQRGRRAASEDDHAPPWDVAAGAPERGVLGLSGPLFARIPPEVVQRPVRERFSCFRGCYEQGLILKPDLRGRVVIDFTIDGASGKVKSVADRGSTLPDKLVIACILDEMKLVRFPAPEGKDVQVVYPINFVPPVTK